MKIRKTIIVTCGDRADEAVRYLKEKLGYFFEYVITTAGASKALTLAGCTESEVKFYVEKKKAVMFDLEIYIGDNDEILIILLDHNWCAAWQKFLSEKLEKRAHIKSLQSAKKIIESELKKKNPKLNLLIKLFYVKRDDKKRIIKMEEVKHY
jgi:hypothetical protein